MLILPPYLRAGPVAAGEPPGEGVFFNPDLGSFTAGTGRSSLTPIFTHDVNNYGGVTMALQTAVTRPGGMSKAIEIGYPSDEAGVELQPDAFPATETLFTRSYEYFAPGWATNWPVGLKTGRFFTTSNFSTGSADPNANAYCSEKLAWNTYEGDPDDLYSRGYNNATFNLDLVGTYAGLDLGYGNPYLEEGKWYKFERWYVINSAVNAADGVMLTWINDELVINRTNVVWCSTSRGCPNGLDGWQSMWFGGNYSGATFGSPSATVYRYIDSPYLSTTLDR